MPQFTNAVVYTALTSRLVALPVDNIDTDQIIPARYLKVTDKAGLGEGLFTDWRYHPDGAPTHLGQTGGKLQRLDRSRFHQVELP